MWEGSDKGQVTNERSVFSVDFGRQEYFHRKNFLQLDEMLCVLVL